MSDNFPDHYFGDKRPEVLPALNDISADRTNYKRHLISFIENLPEKAHVLDVACGAGKTIKLIRVLRPDVKISGMDITNTTDFLPSGTNFSQGAVEDLATMYSAGSFDAVICQHLVEHLVYPIPLMNGIRHVLRKDGLVFMETPNWTRLLVPFSHLWFWSDYTHIRPSSYFAMHRLFSESGFVPKRILTVSSCKLFPRKKKQQENTTSYEIKQQIPTHTLLSRVVSRIVNPLLRDVIIGIAIKP